MTAAPVNVSPSERRMPARQDSAGDGDSHVRASFETMLTHWSQSLSDLAKQAIGEPPKAFEQARLLAGHFIIFGDNAQALENGRTADAIRYDAETIAQRQGLRAPHSMHGDSVLSGKAENFAPARLRDASMVSAPIGNGLFRSSQASGAVTLPSAPLAQHSRTPGQPVAVKANENGRVAQHITARGQAEMLPLLARILTGEAGPLVLLRLPKMTGPERVELESRALQLLAESLGPQRHRLIVQETNGG